MGSNNVDEDLREDGKGYGAERLGQGEGGEDRDDLIVDDLVAGEELDLLQCSQLWGKRSSLHDGRSD